MLPSRFMERRWPEQHLGLAEPASLRVSLQFYHLQGDLTLALVDEAGRLLDDLVVKGVWAGPPETARTSP